MRDIMRLSSIISQAIFIICLPSLLFAADGDLKWIFTPGGDWGISYPAIGSDGTIYVSAGFAQDVYYVYAINPDGTQKWISPALQGDPAMPAIGPNGTIYSAKGHHVLYAIRPNGNLKWQFDFKNDNQINRGVNDPLAIAEDGIIYAGVSPDNLYAINPNGTKKWSYRTWVFGTWSKAIHAPAIDANGNIYVVARPTGLHAFNPNGTLKWKNNSTSSLNGNYCPRMAIRDGSSIIVDELGDGLNAIDQNGLGMWYYHPPFVDHYTPSSSYEPAIIGIDGTIYKLWNDFYALYPDGTIKWSIEYAYEPVAVGADGNIYCQTKVLGPDGSIKWTYPEYVPGSDMHATMLGPDGTLYGYLYGFGINDSLIAIETSSGGPAQSSWPMLQHNIRRTGRTVDITPPSVTATKPSSDAKCVGINIPIAVNFSEAIDPNTLSNTTFEVSGPEGSIPGTVQYNATTLSSVFTSSIFLNHNTTYTGTITTDLSDYAGHNMVSPYSWNFTTGNNEFKLLPSDGYAGDNFGESVSISGDYAIVGSKQDDDNGQGSGSAYIFKRNEGIIWNQVAKLTASDGAANDNFGKNVSISGDFAIVGATGDDDIAPYSGSAYIFERSGDTWNQVAKLTASDGAAYDNFGKNVSISGDFAIVGATGDDDIAPNSGSAYVFERSGDTWNQVAKLTASDGDAGDLFGCSVSLSGKYAIVGAYADNDIASDSGSAYIFKRSGGTWDQVAKLGASDGAYLDVFGTSVSISGDYAIIGATGDDDNGQGSGSAYIFKRNGDTWNHVAKLTASDGEEYDYFGTSVSILGDYAIVGARYDDDDGTDSGSAYIFERNGSTWNQIAKLTASDADDGDRFGWSVSISGDYAIVGALWDRDNGKDSGSAYIFGIFNCTNGMPRSMPWMPLLLLDN